MWGAGGAGRGEARAPREEEKQSDKNIVPAEGIGDKIPYGMNHIPALFGIQNHQQAQKRHDDERKNQYRQVQLPAFL